MLSATRPATNKKSPRWPAVCALLGVALLAACSPSGPDLLRKGERLIEQGNYSEAIVKLEAARALLPQTALVYNQLGLAYHGAGRVPEAIQAYGQALRLNRDLYAANYNLGCLQLEQNNLPAAVSALTTFTTLQPAVADGWFKLASAQYRAKQLDAAERSLTHGLKLRPKDPVALNTVGMIRLSRKNPTDATGYFEDALKAQPGFAPALLNLAVTYHQHLNKHAAALEKYRAYLALQPKPANWDAVNQIAQQLEHELNPTPKVATPVPAAVRTQSATTVKAAPIASLPMVQSNPAPAAVVAATQSNRPQPKTTTTTPAPKTAAPVSNVAVRTTPTQPVATQKVELVQLEPDEPIKPAKEVTIVASAPKPKLVVAREPAPVETTPMVAETESTPTKRPGFFQRLNPVRWFSSSDASKAGTQPEPVKVAKATASKPAKPTPIPDDGTSTKSPGRETVDTTPPSTAEVTPPARYAYLRPRAATAGNRTEAERYFSRGVKNQRDGKLTQAVTEYLAAIEADAGYFEAHYNLGLAAFELGHIARSLSAYEHALSIKPTHVDARFNFALALQKGGYTRDAANELEKLLAENPDEARAHLTLANLFAQQLGQPAKAREHYLKVLQLEPRHPQATAIRYWISGHP